MRLAGLLLLTGCALGHRPLELPVDDPPHVVLVSGSMPGSLGLIARHAWFGIYEDGRWRRLEVGGSRGTPLTDYGGGGGVILHASWSGERAAEAIACLEREAPPWKAKLRYLPWPGPNSNTFVDKMLRLCRLHASLSPTSVGKDFRGFVVGASKTTGGTGVQLETPLVGLRIGLKEGIEIHVLAFAIGIDLWPPAILVPFGHGRIGFADRP